jgi:hypothetical protein
VSLQLEIRPPIQIRQCRDISINTSPSQRDLTPHQRCKPPTTRSSSHGLSPNRTLLNIARSRNRKLSSSLALSLIMLHSQPFNHTTPRIIILRSLHLFRPVSIRFLPTTLTRIPPMRQQQHPLLPRPLHIGLLGSNMAFPRSLHALLATPHMISLFLARYIQRQILPPSHLDRICTIYRQPLLPILQMAITMPRGTIQLQLLPRRHILTLLRTLHSPHHRHILPP